MKPNTKTKQSVIVKSQRAFINDQDIPSLLAKHTAQSIDYNI